MSAAAVAAVAGLAARLETAVFAAAPLAAAAGAVPPADAGHRVHARPGGRGEHALDRVGEFVDEQRVDEPAVGELGVGECEPDADERVLAQASRLGGAGAGRDQRVPDAAGLIGGVTAWASASTEITRPS